MGKALKLLWQTVKVLLRIYNMTQPISASLEVMTQIADLFQDIMQLLKTLNDKDLCKDIYWELGVFKQKMYQIADRCRQAVEHVDVKLVYFTNKPKQSSPLLAPSPDSVVETGREISGWETPPTHLADSPDSLAPSQHCYSRKLAEEQAWACEDPTDCEECVTLRQQLHLAERLCFLAGEIQNLVAQTPS
ncbi:agnoprotein [Rhinolophus thomasi polyomavirus 1]|nr:agnoprotein [Rhinolophus thomasi polyomavirus 1]